MLRREDDDWLAQLSDRWLIPGVLLSYRGSVGVIVARRKNPFLGGKGESCDVLWSHQIAPIRVLTMSVGWLAQECALCE